MTGELISMIAASVIMLTTFLMGLYIWIDEYDKWSGFGAFICIVLLGFLGALLFGSPSFISIVKDKEDVFVNPTAIVRTNNVTHVVYIHPEKTYTETSTDAKYWNATNIQVRIRNGKNIWGIEVKNEISIINENSEH